MQVDVFPRTVRNRLPFLAAVFMLLAGCGRGGPDEAAVEAPAARFVRRIDWIGSGTWLKADTHIHTRFSDGAHTVNEVVAKGVEFGCDVMAITDHADRGLTAATPEYAEAIEVARREHPQTIIVAGLEWNIPPWGGDEHATVLVPSSPDEFQVLAGFKFRFDDLKRDTHQSELADAALRWLEKSTPTGHAKPIVIYNHPSRKDAQSIENVEDLLRWRGVNDVVIGFSGAPGHQAGEPLGSYSYKEKPIDRWDPAAARVGDAWDTLLQKNVDVWAARAASDFHRTPRAGSGWGDYWPGQFSETWLYVPERSVDGVLQAFRAGSFFAAHGHIVREARLKVDAPGLDRPAEAGEAIAVTAGEHINISVECLVPTTDWEGKPNKIDVVELIAVTQGKAEIIARQSVQADGLLLSTTFEVPAGGVVLRARGRRIVSGGPDLMFYTNPVRIVGEQGVVQSGFSFDVRPIMSFGWLTELSILLLALISLVMVARRRPKRTHCKGSRRSNANAELLL